MATLGVKQKRQKQKIAHTRRGIAGTYGEEQVETASIPFFRGATFLRMRGKRLLRDEHEQTCGDNQPDQRHNSDKWPPSHDR
jgi:hypothetical protein